MGTTVEEDEFQDHIGDYAVEAGRVHDADRCSLCAIGTPCSTDTKAATRVRWLKQAAWIVKPLQTADRVHPAMKYCTVIIDRFFLFFSAVFFITCKLQLEQHACLHSSQFRFFFCQLGNLEASHKLLWSEEIKIRLYSQCSNNIPALPIAILLLAARLFPLTIFLLKVHLERCRLNAPASFFFFVFFCLFSFLLAFQ